MLDTAMAVDWPKYNIVILRLLVQCCSVRDISIIGNWVVNTSRLHGFVNDITDNSDNPADTWDLLLISVTEKKVKWNYNKLTLEVWVPRSLDMTDNT